MKIEGVQEQTLGDATIYSSKTRVKTIYGYIVVMIRQIGFEPIIRNLTNLKVIQFC